MTVPFIVLAALALFGFGAVAVALRRSLIGMLAGVEVCAAALMLLASAMFDYTGVETSTGQVIVTVLLAFAAAAAVVVVALHLAAVRAARRTSDLEPW